MGIKGLLKFCRDANPEVRQVIDLTEMRGRKIAIDIAVKAYAYKSEYITKVAPSLDLFYQDVNYVEATKFMFQQVLKLYSHIVLAGVLPVTVFDGKPPELKQGTKRDRAAKADKKRNRISNLRRIGRALLEDPQHILSALDLDFLANLPTDIRTIDDIRSRLLTEVKGFISVTGEDYQKLAIIFSNLGLPYIYAESEAEKTCAIMARHRDVLAVLTTDSDCLVYGCPIMIERIEYKTSATIPIPPKAHCYSFTNVLAVTGLSNAQFIDFCIMCGTDFNKNPPGFGPGTSLQVLQYYGSIKEIVKAQIILNDRITMNPWASINQMEKYILGFDATVLNYDEVCEFFIRPITYDRTRLDLRIEFGQYDRAMEALKGILGEDIQKRFGDIIKKLSDRLINLSKFLK